MNELSQYLTGKLTRCIFRVQSILLLLFLLAFFVEALVVWSVDPVYASCFYPVYLEYFPASLCILVGSLFLAEAHERDLRRR